MELTKRLCVTDKEMDRSNRKLYLSLSCSPTDSDERDRSIFFLFLGLKLFVFFLGTTMEILERDKLGNIRKR